MSPVRIPPWSDHPSPACMLFQEPEKSSAGSEFVTPTKRCTSEDDWCSPKFKKIVAAGREVLEVCGLGFNQGVFQPRHGWKSPPKGHFQRLCAYAVKAAPLPACPKCCALVDEFMKPTSPAGAHIHPWPSHFHYRLSLPFISGTHLSHPTLSVSLSLTPSLWLSHPRPATHTIPHFFDSSLSLTLLLCSLWCRAPPPPKHSPRDPIFQSSATP